MEEKKTPKDIKQERTKASNLEVMYRKRSRIKKGKRQINKRQPHKWMNSEPIDAKCENPLKKTSLRHGNGAGQKERLTLPLQSRDIRSLPLTKCHWAHLAGSADRPVLISWSLCISAAAPPRGSALLKKRPGKAGSLLLLLLPGATTWTRGVYG